LSDKFNNRRQISLKDILTIVRQYNQENREEKEGAATIEKKIVGNRGLID
jgi:hypothetical protein